MDTNQVIALRAIHLPKNLSISYSKPIHVVEGKRQFLYSKEGHQYLDVVNNVAHVGHSHPDVGTYIYIC